MKYRSIFKYSIRHLLRQILPNATSLIRPDFIYSTIITKMSLSREVTHFKPTLSLHKKRGWGGGGYCTIIFAYMQLVSFEDPPTPVVMKNQVKQYDGKINQEIIHCQVNHIWYVLALSSVCTLVNKRFNQGLPRLLLKVVLWITLSQTIVHHIHFVHSKNIQHFHFI